MRESSHRRRALRHGCPWEELVQLSIKLELRRRQAELNLAGAVLADHQPLVAIASLAGIRGHHFQYDDAKLIYCAAVVARQHDLPKVLRLAQMALANERFWDESEIAGNPTSMLWSSSKLAALADAYPALAANVTTLANRLIDIDQRQAEARASYRRCISALDGTLDIHAQTELRVAA